MTFPLPHLLLGSIWGLLHLLHSNFQEVLLSPPSIIFTIPRNLAKPGFFFQNRFQFCLHRFSFAIFSMQESRVKKLSNHSLAKHLKNRREKGLKNFMMRLSKGCLWDFYSLLHSIAQIGEWIFGKSIEFLALTMKKWDFYSKIAKYVKKILKNPKYVNLPKNGKICKKIFFTYLHKNPGPSHKYVSLVLLKCYNSVVGQHLYKFFTAMLLSS